LSKGFANNLRQAAGGRWQVASSNLQTRNQQLAPFVNYHVVNYHLATGQKSRIQPGKKSDSWMRGVAHI
jgi:hypothetical protein